MGATDCAGASTCITSAKSEVPHGRGPRVFDALLCYLSLISSILKQNGGGGNVDENLGGGAGACCIPFGSATEAGDILTFSFKSYFHVLVCESERVNVASLIRVSRRDNVVNNRCGFIKTYDVVYILRERASQDMKDAKIMRNHIMLIIHSQRL